MTRHYRTLLLSLLIPVFGFAASAPEQSAQLPPPTWQSLKFVQQAFWVKAVSEIRMEPCPIRGSEPRWCFSASNSVAENREELRLETQSDGALIYRERQSVGRKQRRLKRWHYTGEGILRLRLEPAKTGRADNYVTTSERRLDYPPAAGMVTDPLLLLTLAAPGQSGRPAKDRLTVQTDLNFYDVTFILAGEQSLDVDWELDGKRVRDSRRVSLVRLEVRPLEPLLDEPDFSLLGLSGAISIAFDSLTGIPLQLRGDAPRLGSTEINLVAATRRQPPP